MLPNPTPPFEYTLKSWANDYTLIEPMKWCVDNCVEGDWSVMWRNGQPYMQFWNETDAIMFYLYWCNQL